MRGIEQFLQVDAATLGALKYAGTWNASTNTPTLASGVGVQGQYYVVSVAGSTNLDGETAWQVGDWAVFNGSVWQKVDGGSTGLLTTLTVTGNTYLATTSGDVGIGTSSPAQKLDVQGATNPTIKVRNITPGVGNYSQLYLDTNNTFSGAGAAYLQAISENAGNSAVSLALGVNANGGGAPSEAMRITSAGDVGIGTSSPAVRLQLEQAANSAPVTLLRLNNSGTTAGGPGIASRISFTAGATALGFIQGSNFASGAAGLQFSGDGTNAQATLDASGNLGLGVTPSASWPSGTRAIQFGPSSALYNPGSGSRAIFASNAIFTSGISTATYITSNAAAFYDQDNGTHKWNIAPSGTAGNAISFTQAMTLDASGNLGIGTSSPWSQLTVGSGGTANPASTVSFHKDTVSEYRLKLTSSLFNSDGAWLGLGFGYSDNYMKAAIIAEAKDANARANLHFALNDATSNANASLSDSKMVLTYAGNLGLGVTPSASTIAQFEGGSNLILVGRGNVYASNNATFNSGWKYISTAVAAQYNISNAEHKWLTAPSGTAGNAISFIQAMTLDASGRLLVGTTTAGIGDNNATALSVANGTATVYQSIRASGGEELYLYSAAGSVGLYSYTNHPLVFGTNNSERARIPSAGGMVVGTAAIATTATDGFLYVPTCAGTPTGTPTTQTGTAPIVIDTTNNKLYFYSGGQWRDAGP